MGLKEFSSSSSSFSRLKREDCKRTKHDSVFSQWQVLIGPLDWENYLSGKDGIEKYRIHNIPISCSCPGLYELGVAAIHTDLGRDVRKLDSDSIIVVYLGEADNIRTRLQHYGRAGSHLDCGKTLGDPRDSHNSCSQKGPGLFRETFSRGFPIVFRWAPMENKKEAANTEAQLLGIFDYAWNKGGNGARRSNDIYLKLDKIASRNISSPKIGRKLQQWMRDHTLSQKKEGIKIKTIVPPLKEIKSSTCNDRETDYHYPPIFKFGRSRPRLVTVRHGVNEEGTTVCGLSLGDGSFCTRRPIEGRKRCGEHKGKRNIGSFSGSVTQGKSLGFKEEALCMEVPIHGRKSCELHEGKTVGHSQVPDGKFLPEEFVSVCGVTLNDGSVCKNRPSEGRKRCGKHRGMRVSHSQEKSLGFKDESLCLEVPMHAGQSCELHNGKTVGHSQVPEGNFLPEEFVSICGVTLNDGSVCKNRPSEGRKRCGKHKGMRINVPICRSVTEGRLPICGVGLGDGHICMEVPVRGRKRCELHKGMRVHSV